VPVQGKKGASEIKGTKRASFYGWGGKDVGGGRFSTKEKTRGTKVKKSLKRFSSSWGGGNGRVLKKKASSRGKDIEKKKDGKGRGSPRLAGKSVKKKSPRQKIIKKTRGAKRETAATYHRKRGHAKQEKHNTKKAEENRYQQRKGRTRKE